MRRVKIYAVTAIWAVSMLLFPNFASAGAITSTTNLEVPLAISVLVPCANGGAGEVVDVSGTLHVLLHFTLSDSGRVTLKEHFQPQGASGVGGTDHNLLLAARARFTFSRMSEALAVQTNGFGSVLCCAM